MRLRDVALAVEALENMLHIYIDGTNNRRLNGSVIEGNTCDLDVQCGDAREKHHHIKLTVIGCACQRRRPCT